MRCADIKEVLNPFILLPIVIGTLFLIGYRSELLILSFSIFFSISLIINFILVFLKGWSSHFYFFVYVESFICLIFILPVIYYLDISIFFTFAVFGAADFLIQSWFTIFPRRDSKRVIDLWKDRLIKCKREYFHPISMPKYVFKDFVLKITDLEKKNLCRNYIFHGKFLQKLSSNLVRHQFVNRKSYIFFLDGNFELEDNCNINGKLQNEKYLNYAKEIDKGIFSNLNTIQKHTTGVKITLPKNYVLTNPENVYSFLKRFKERYSRQKTLFLLNNFPPHVGGTCSLFYNICKNWKGDFSVVTQKAKGDREFDRKEDLDIYRVKRLVYSKGSILRDFLIYFRSFFFLRRLVKDVDFVISDNYANALPLSFMKVPYFVYCHGEEIYSDRGRFVERIKRRTLSRSKGLIAVSDFTKSLVEIYNDSVKVIYNAVDTSKFYPEEKSDLLLQGYELKGNSVLLTVGRLEKRKNHKKVIDILPSLLKNHNVKYMIVGEGEEKENLKSYAKDKGVSENVVFTGKVNNLRSFYNLCDVFVMPNITLTNGDTEGFGIVFLEANACGKPVVGGDAGGVPSAIRDGYNGFLVNDEIYDKVKKLLNDENLRKEMGENGRKWAKEFNYDRLVKELREFVR